MTQSFHEVRRQSYRTHSLTHSILINLLIKHSSKYCFCLRVFSSLLAGFLTRVDQDPRSGRCTSCPLNEEPGPGTSLSSTTKIEVGHLNVFMKCAFVYMLFFAYRLLFTRR